MRTRTIAVAWGVTAVAGGALLLAWLHATASSYGAADPAYDSYTAMREGGSNLPMLVLYATLAVVGVCLAALGWWRPFLVGVALAYLAPLVGGDLAPLIGDVPERMSSGGMAALEAALLAAPTWVVAERSHSRARPLPIPSRLALPGRPQHALPGPKHT